MEPPRSPSSPSCTRLLPDDLEGLLQDLCRPFSRAQRRAEERLVRMGEAVVEPVAALLFSGSSDAFTRGVALRVLERVGTPPVIPHMLRAVREARDGAFSLTPGRRPC